MPSLVAQRCLHHPDREAIARCPECGRFFCRECITEHEDKVICASCLHRLAEESKAPRGGTRWWPLVFPVVRAFAGVLAAWIIFYMVGRFLMTIPSDFHFEMWENLFSQSADD